MGCIFVYEVHIRIWGAYTGSGSSHSRPPPGRGLQVVPGGTGQCCWTRWDLIHLLGDGIVSWGEMSGSSGTTLYIIYVPFRIVLGGKDLIWAVLGLCGKKQGVINPPYNDVAVPRRAHI